MRFHKAIASHRAWVVMAVLLAVTCLARDARADDPPPAEWREPVSAAPPVRLHDPGAERRRQHARDHRVPACGVSQSVRAPAEPARHRRQGRRQSIVDGDDRRQRPAGSDARDPGHRRCRRQSLPRLGRRHGGWWASRSRSARRSPRSSSLRRGASRRWSYSKDATSSDLANSDAARSFPSGHTAATFSAATSYAITFWKRHPDSPWRIVVLVAGEALASRRAS